jgi:hypothetical protein
MADFYVNQGDLLPALTGTLLNPDLSAVDLTGATISLELFQMATSTLITLPAQVAGADPTLGLVEHIWVAGETNTSGAYFYHWVVSWPGPTGPESFPNDTRGLVLSIVRGNVMGGSVTAQALASSVTTP